MNFDRNTFATEVSESQNFVLSPVGLFQSLMLVSTGAKGDTLTEFRKLFSVDPSIPTDALIKSLTNDVNRINSKKNITCQINNLILCDDSVVPEFVTNVSKACTLEMVDFSQPSVVVEKVNKIVAVKTNDMITKLLNESDIDALTKMIILNTLYLKGSWDVPFKKVNDDCLFRNHLSEDKKVSMMEVSDKFGYFEDDHCQMLEMTYKDRETVFGVILPKKDTVDKINLDTYLNNTKLEYKQVCVKVPKFEQRHRKDMVSNLKSQGLKLAFDDKLADFTGMSTKQIQISKVIQETVIKVDKDGTEASSATAVIMNTKCCQTEKPALNFTADHTFIYYVRDKETIYFIGSFDGN